MPVEVVHFNPKRPIGKGPLRFLSRRPLNNFGDLIGPVLVDRIVRDLGISEPSEKRRMLAVGSIMKLSRPGDVVWGSGVNGKSLGVGGGAELDVRAVRGPLTGKLLREAGASVPAVYGDPALLWSRYWPRESYDGEIRPVTVVPNFHDYPAYSHDARVIDPLSNLHHVIGAIARSDFVCGSSLHGIVIAESFGIPARLVVPGTEPRFKYEDYYSGTGRVNHNPARSVAEAVAAGGEPPPSFDAEALLEAFPQDLWVDNVQR